MGTPCQIDVKLAKVENRKNATVKDRSGGTYKAPVFMVRSEQFFTLVNSWRVRTLGWRRCQRSSAYQLEQRKEAWSFGNQSRTHWYNRESVRCEAKLRFLAISAWSRTTRFTEWQCFIWFLVQSRREAVRNLQRYRRENKVSSLTAIITLVLSAK